MTECWLREEFQREWQNKDAFAEVRQLEGKLFRKVAARRTIQFPFAGRSYFLKAHYGVGWKEIFKSLLSGRLPVLGARQEWDAIHRLEELGVETMTAAGFGERGRNPAALESFIITEDLVGTVSLEDFCEHWQSEPPAFLLKRALLRRVAWMSRTLHDNGVNHRDFYICHFHLDTRDEAKLARGEDLHLYLIDLHRAQLRDKTPRRWRVKDTAGLYFSAMDIGLTRWDVLRFMRWYSGKPLKQTLRDDLTFWQAVQKQALQNYHKLHNKPPTQVVSL